VNTVVVTPSGGTVTAAATPANTVTPAIKSLPATGSPDTVAAASTTPASTSSLPFTGADVEELAGLGIAAVLFGGVMVRRRRRSAA
jgi:LPXTG-motif cell wall-anchored protein